MEVFVIPWIVKTIKGFYMGVATMFYAKRVNNGDHLTPLSSVTL